MSLCIRLAALLSLLGLLEHMVESMRGGASWVSLLGAVCVYASRIALNATSALAVGVAGFFLHTFTDGMLSRALELHSDTAGTAVEVHALVHTGVMCVMLVAQQGTWARRVGVLIVFLLTTTISFSIGWVSASALAPQSGTWLSELALGAGLATLIMLCVDPCMGRHVHASAASAQSP